jgi:hypothetical protein
VAVRLDDPFRVCFSSCPKYQKCMQKTMHTHDTWKFGLGRGDRVGQIICITNFLPLIFHHQFSYIFFILEYRPSLKELKKDLAIIFFICMIFDIIYKVVVLREKEKKIKARS